MMKRFSRLFLLFLLCLAFLLFRFSAKISNQDSEAEPGPEFHGMWISSVYNLDYPSQTGLSAAALQAEADSIIAYAKSVYVTDLFLQVRACGDALYASRIFPWSP